jgi:hypothetical protein
MRHGVLTLRLYKYLYCLRWTVSGAARQARPPVPAAAAAHRTERDDAVLTVRKIRVLLDAGLTSEVIRAVLPCTRGDRPEFDWCADIRDLLARELAALDGRIAGLQRNRSTLAAFLSPDE